MSRDRAEEALARFRPWFAAAAIYNLLWGSITIVFPDALFRFLRMPPPSYLAVLATWDIRSETHRVHQPVFPFPR